MARVKAAIANTPKLAPRVNDKLRRPLDRLRTSLLFATLLMNYLNLGILIGAHYYSGAFTLLLGILLLIVHLFLLRSQAWKIAVPFAICSLAWAITIPLSPGTVGDHLKATITLALSTLVALGVYFEIRTISPSKIEKAALIIFIVLMVLGILEAYTPLRVVSDTFRDRVFSGAFLYDSDARDAAISFGVRPKVFTQEPSHYAKALALSLACWVILSQQKRTILVGTGAWLVALFVTGSPTTLLAGGAVVLERVFRHPPNYIGAMRYASRLVMVVIPIVLLVMLQTVASFIPLGRMQQIASGDDISSVTRTIAPPLIAYESILEYPVAGTGIGGRETVQSVLVNVYSHYPHYDMDKLNNGVGYVGWGNAFFEIPVYGGFLTIVFITLICWAFTKLYPSWLLAFGCFFIIFNFDSGFTSPRPWMNFMILMAACWARYNRDRPTRGFRRRVPPAMNAAGISSPIQGGSHS